MNEELDILILTASFGAGHNNVAKAIGEQILLVNQNTNILIKDLFELTSPNTKKYLYKTYEYLTKSHPNIYNYFYCGKKNKPQTTMDNIVYRFNVKKLADYISLVQPKIIISTFPICSGMVSEYKKKYGSNIPLVTCITDVVDSYEWIHSNTDLYFVPTNNVRDRLINKGVLRERIKITGVPVRKEFLRNYIETDELAFDTQHTSKGNKKLLIMGGGRGLLEIDNNFLEWVDKLQGVEVTIVTGTNQELYNSLISQDKYTNIKVIGFTDKISCLMKEADLLISKPGGVTLFEAINMGVPIAVNKPKIGQEIENSNFIENTGIGIVKDGVSNLKSEIQSFFSNKSKLDKIHNNLDKIRQEIEPYRIGEYVFDLLGYC